MPCFDGSPATDVAESVSLVWVRTAYTRSDDGLGDPKRAGPDDNKPSPGHDVGAGAHHTHSVTKLD